jgi:DNA-binding CsgD family transcriptional regulator
MGLIGAGMSNKEIATRLNVGIHTVKTHVHNVLGKLAVRTRLEVAALLHAADTARAREQFSRVA